ncbi:hypothetical protein PV797_10950 [Clostridiaceae bacterium M8S5]|nr:hypothetical protein PV797_10950 [Clostridiaceae bacterium M8S5]
MRNIAKKDSLVDIKDIDINTKLEPSKRIQKFIDEVKNPYLFKCEGMIVESVFSSDNHTLSDRLKQYFRIVE